MTPELTPDTFWEFSGALYTRGDAAVHCLALQDNHGVNVNLLLLVCWCMQHNVIVTLPQLATLQQAIAQQDATLVAHRTRRRAAHPEHGGNEADYAALKAQELALERQCQAVLVTTLNGLAVSRFDGDALNPTVVAFIHHYQLKSQPKARASLSYLMSQLEQAE